MKTNTTVDDEGFMRWMARAGVQQVRERVRISSVPAGRLLCGLNAGFCSYCVSSQEDVWGRGRGGFTTADHRRPDSALRENKASLFHLHELAEKAGVKLERAVQCKCSRVVCTSNTKPILFFIKIGSIK